jgi:hypothetical protein
MAVTNLNHLTGRDPGANDDVLDRHGARVASASRITCVDLSEQPRDLPPRVRMHRQEVDDVGPVLAVLIAVRISLLALRGTQEETRPRPAEATFLSERGCADRG